MAKVIIVDTSYNNASQTDFISVKESLCNPNETQITNTILNLTEELNSLALELFQSLWKIREDGNLLVSPLFIHTILALCYVSGCVIPPDIKNYLNLTSNRELTVASYLILSQFLSNFNLTVSFSTIIDKRIKLRNQVIENYKNYFDIEIKQFDFDCEKTKIKKYLNKWVQSKTEGKIAEFLLDSVIPLFSNIVLINGLHFKNKWFKYFKNFHRNPIKFYINNNEFVRINMMYVADKFRFIHHIILKCKILELPYEENNCSMIIILPDEISGMKQLEDDLTTCDLIRELSEFKQVERKELGVILPKFSLSQTLDLKKILISIGIRDIFDIDTNLLSNLNKTASSAPIFVSNVCLKSVIEVDEDGAVLDDSDFNVPENIPINHPFIFLIIKNDIIDNFLILFIGKYGYFLNDIIREKCCDECICCKCNCC